MEPLELDKKVYVILNPDDIATLKKYKYDDFCNGVVSKGVTLANCITPYQIEEIRNENKVKLPKTINEGDVLIYTGEDSYEVIRDTTDFENILKSRIPIIQQIVRLLGCTYFKGFDKIICRKNDSAKGSVDCDTSVNIKTETVEIPIENTASANMNVNVYENQHGKVDTYSVYDVLPVTEENYKEAIRLACENDLYEDKWMRYLIDQRNPNGRSSVLKQTRYTISLTRDSTIGWACEGRLASSIKDILNCKFDISLEKKCEEHNHYEFSFIASFVPGVIKEGEFVEDAEDAEDNSNNGVVPPILSVGSLVHSENLNNTQPNVNICQGAIVRIESLEKRSHEHKNQLVLSGITADKVENWDNAELNAKTYADDLNSTTIVRVEGLEAQAHEHPNEDALSEISIGSIALWNTSPKIIAECDARLNIEKIRINNLEKKSHEHKNNEILEHINEDNIKSWNAAESNAKKYTESVSSRAEQSAKDYANQ